MQQRLAYDGKLCIATPFYNRQCTAPYAQSLFDTARLCERLGVQLDFITAEDSYVDRARNTLCQMFLESDCTDLLFIDSDESWDGMGLFRVLMAPFPVVGASYKMKNSWDEWTANLVTENGHPKGKTIREGVTLLEAYSIPCGFMRIKKSVLEHIKEKHPELKYRNQGKEQWRFFESSSASGEYIGEDVNFCNRWRALGGQVWVDPNVTITHYGMNGWEGNLDKQLRRNLFKGDHESQRAAA